MFIARMRSGPLTPPWIVQGAMSRAAFELYVETEFAPIFSVGDAVILDCLNVHYSQRAEDALDERSTWFTYLPKHFTDENPVEAAL